MNHNTMWPVVPGLGVCRIVGTFDRKNVWRIYFFKRLAEKSLVNEWINQRFIYGNHWFFSLVNRR